MADLREYDHSDRISDSELSTLGATNNGDIVKFTYMKDGEFETRTVLVLEKNANFKLHGLDLTYISERELVDFFQTAQGNLPNTTSDALEADLPVLNLEINNPQSFYESTVKVFPFEQNAYRTFDLMNVARINSVVYTTELSTDAVIG